MKQMVFLSMALVSLCSIPKLARADFIIAHQGNTDPTTENFGLWPYNGGIAYAPLDDGGQATWQIVNSGAFREQALYSQLGGTGPYYQGGSGLTQQQIDDIVARGFIMTLRARIIDGPVYDPNGTKKVSAIVSVAGFHPTRRFDIGLGSDGQGNTLVVLPVEIFFDGGIFFSYTPFGSPLLITGNDYHVYLLSYDPVTDTAALYVDGVQQVTGYPGSMVDGGAVFNNYGLLFGSLNTATANFAAAQLDSRPL